MNEPPKPLPQANVPVFSCTIYVKELPDGKVTARCANLAGFEAMAGSEPDALRAIITSMKSELARLADQQQQPAWLETPLPIEDGESERFTVLHL